MRISKQVICICLVYLIPRSLCESDCLFKLVSSNGCDIYRVSSPHPGQPCQLMEKTVPLFTFFLKPEPDFKNIEVRINTELRTYHRVQYGSVKLDRDHLMQRRSWNEIALRDRTTINYEGLTWISYFLEVNGQRKDISNDPEHTVPASNFQILISGSAQWSSGCGMRLNAPFFIEPRLTTNIAIKKRRATKNIYPIDITGDPVSATLPITSLPTLILPTNIPTISRTAESISTNILTTVPTSQSTTTLSPISTSPGTVLPTQISTEARSTSSIPSIISTLTMTTISIKPTDITTIASTSTTTPTSMPTLPMDTTEVPTTTIPATILPTEEPTTAKAATLPTKIPTSTMATTEAPFIPITEGNIITELANVTQIATETSNIIDDTITSDIIATAEIETMQQSNILTSTSLSSNIYASDTSEVQWFPSTSLSSAIIDQEFSNTDDSFINNTATGNSDNINDFTTISSVFITRILSTLQSEEYSSPSLTETTQSSDIADELVTSPSEITTMNTHTINSRSPKLITISPSSDVLSANSQFSFTTFEPTLPLPLWQMIIYAALVDVAIVILLLCIFLLVSHCEKKREEKRVQEEIDHFAFTEYIKRNLQPNSTEADAHSLYGMSGRVGPGADSEREEADNVSVYGLGSLGSRGGPGIDRVLESHTHIIGNEDYDSDD